MTKKVYASVIISSSKKKMLRFSKPLDVWDAVRFVTPRTCLSIVSSPFCRRGLSSRNKPEEYYNINAAAFSTDARDDPREYFEAIDRKKIDENPRKRPKWSVHKYSWTAEGSRVRGSMTKSSFRGQTRNLAFRREFRVSAGFRGPDFRRFWHFQNALPRARFRNVYCKILLPPRHTHLHVLTHIRARATLCNVTRRTTLLHETGTMHFTTTPYAARTAPRSRPFFHSYSQWFFSLRVTAQSLIW